MTPGNKLKNRRGTTLIEVLMVVALMAIMLGIAMPNILAESQKIKLATMDGYARSVAVAVQSKLYGMKSAGTQVDSAYANLNEAAEKDCIMVADEEKAVNYVCNFGKNGAKGKQFLLSGAITDTEILQNGKIVVIYDPNTANVLETYYSESEFEISALFPTVSKPFLQEHMIGSYLGDGAPEPELVASFPRFSAIWKDDDEKYLELTMIDEPDPELLDKPLGLEVYALIPKDDEPEKWDPLLIYAEGLVANDYTATKATKGVLTQVKYNNGIPEVIEQKLNTIASETDAPLTLSAIQATEDRTLRFAIDSLVIPKAMYDDAKIKGQLYRQVYPKNISAAEPVLYPRDSFDNWLNGLYNPYISFGIDSELYEISEDLKEKVFQDDTKATDYVAPDQMIELRVKLYVLDKNEDGNYVTESIKGGFGGARYVADENYAPVVIDSQVTSPYFRSFSAYTNEVALASVRDLQNLKYIFETENKITQARLYHDIDITPLYEKLVRVRYALIGKNPNVQNQWPSYANADVLQTDPITYADGASTSQASFTISGSNGNGGRYAIKNVQAGGASWGSGGLIQYAKNITVKDLDIVNPKVWRISFKANFIDTNENGEITGINVQWDNCVSGGLFGVAENCTFTNVHCYNDGAEIFKQELWDATRYDPETWVPSPMSTRYVSGTVAGGLVGIAVGANNKTTTFTNCSASTQINSYYYGAMTQCVYAGGLVGIAMGNVTIQNSYAACQLSGYYSGGLVGAVAQVPFTYKVHIHNGYWSDGVWHKDWWEAEYEKGLSGKLTIENSFSAGHIQHQTMVGGGLIAQTNGAKVTAENCYSASVWEILPPIAYGTFEDDTSNYYLVQNEINVPITLNTEARFTRTAGDVLSLSDKNSGVAVTANQLESQLTENWADAERTLQWWNKSNNGAPTFLLPTDKPGLPEDGTSTLYPFPMPSGNTEFRGDWNQDNVTDIEGAFDTTFDGFYCVYFYRSDDGYQRFIDATAVYELGFGFSGTDITLPGLRIEITNSVTEPQNIWWASNENAGGGDVAAFGTGVAGMTDVTATETTVTFTGAPYYNSKYNPTKGYVGIDVSKDSQDSGRYLNWDYYGWYIAYGLGKLGYLAPSATGVLSNSSVADFTVSEAVFQEAVGYKSFYFEQNGNKTEIVYGDGYFHVQEGA